MSDPATSPAPLEAFHAALREDDAEDLYEHAPCGYLSTTVEGVIVKANATLADWTGFSRDHLVGSRFVDLLTPGGRIYYETHFAPLLQMQGSVREIAVDLACAGGRRLPVLVNSVLQEGKEGHPPVIRTAVFDATSRREYERELLRQRELARAAEERATELAQTLQASLLPPELPEVEGFRIGAAYRPAGAGTEVGGDFYDVFEGRGGDWAVVLGDVSGKGAPAAALTALTRYIVQASAMRTYQLRGALTTVNAALRRAHPDRFATLVFGRMATGPDGHRFDFTLAGHPPPVFLPVEGPPRFVGEPGALLGVFDDPRLHDSTVTLGPGDAVVLYTDGVTEARKGDRFLGADGLLEAVASVAGESADSVAARVADAALWFQDGTPRDDIAVVVIQAA